MRTRIVKIRSKNPRQIDRNILSEIGPLYTGLHIPDNWSVCNKLHHGTKTIHIQSSKNFQTPLHSACEGGYPLTAMWLLQVGVNPKVKDSLGETALHKAARVGSVECVELLLKVSDNIGYQNLNGQTASAVAHMNGYPNVARLISEREEAGLNAFQNRQIFPVSRMGRKRARDTICDDEICKRHRADDISTSDVLNYMDTMGTSYFEHDKLCSVDFGYRNVIFEAMLTEFHGS
ncbi:ankyrin repeat domain-containing protein 10 [Trichonephila inaurata madagascariensis]|uniref:Ankyrin repeat domain-containing protein 10 n=1 Tax=Trichonephila inaurata madagascariensis TaxID=2747483 RepID=A0A8X7CFN0_9ARAC|nr:ankyrin repeat domain-containing protein 10 [Trichonephila inaurata madagascariensis]